MVDRKDVAGGDGGLPSTEEVLAGVGSLGGEEILGLFFVFVGVSEVDLDEGAASSGVMEHGPHDSSDVALTLGEIEVAISGRRDPLRFRGRVHAALLSLSLA